MKGEKNPVLKKKIHVDWINKRLKQNIIVDPHTPYKDNK